MNFTEIKVLSVSQPWAQLVVLGEKQFEYRAWRPARDWRGLLAIAATKTMTPDAIEACANERFVRRAFDVDRFDDNRFIDELPRASIVGSVEVVEVVEAKSIQWELSDKERAFGDFRDGVLAWRLANPVVLKTPIPVIGRQGLWDAPASIRRAVIESRRARGIEIRRA